MIPGYKPNLGFYGASSGSLYGHLTTLGLTSSLQLCLDAGDAESYDGTSQKWLDRSGGGYDFFRGTDGTAQATDPTFNGTAGKLSSGEYFSGDGADYFTYDTTIETWMQNLGKTGQSVTVFGHIRIPSDTDTTIFGTNSNTNSTGASFGYVASFNKLVYTVQRGDASTFDNAGDAGPDISASLPMTLSCGFAWTLGNGTSYTVHINGTNYTGTSTQAVSSSNAPGGNNMRLMARGDASRIFPSGARLFDLAIWSTKLTDADLQRLHNATKARYGL